ncbi:MAG: VanZ family protein [Ruminococcaceae bacterium]|nr:VanZ family protein [Oscillospiraceae bacterium]
MKRYMRVILPVLTFLVIAFIFSNSLSSGAQASAKRGFVVDLVQEIVSAVGGDEPDFSVGGLAVVSKCFHVTEFALFSFCLTCSVILLGDYRNGRFEKIILCGMTLALTDEHLQKLSEGRGPALTDVLVDLAGVMIGYAVAVLLFSLLAKNEKKKAET